MFLSPFFIVSPTYSSGLGCLLAVSRLYFFKVIYNSRPAVWQAMWLLSSPCCCWLYFSCTHTVPNQCWAAWQGGSAHLTSSQLCHSCLLGARGKEQGGGEISVVQTHQQEHWFGFVSSLAPCWPYSSTSWSATVMQLSTAVPPHLILASSSFATSPVYS